MITLSKIVLSALTALSVTTTCFDAPTTTTSLPSQTEEPNTLKINESSQEYQVVKANVFISIIQFVWNNKWWILFVGTIGVSSYYWIHTVPDDKYVLIYRYGVRPNSERVCEGGLKGFKNSIFYSGGFVAKEGFIVMFPWDSVIDAISILPFSIRPFSVTDSKEDALETADDIPIHLTIDISLRVVDAVKYKYNTGEDPLKEVSDIFDGPIRTYILQKKYEDIQQLSSEKILHELGIKRIDPNHDVETKEGEKYIKDTNILYKDPPEKMRDLVKPTTPEESQETTSGTDIIEILDRSGLIFERPFLQLRDVRPPTEYQSIREQEEYNRAQGNADAAKEEAKVKVEEAKAKVAEVQKEIQKAKNEALEEKIQGRYATSQKYGMSLQEINELEEWLPSFYEKMAENGNMSVYGNTLQGLFQALTEWKNTSQSK